MKTIFTMILLIGSHAFSTAQSSDLIGTWNIIEFSMINDGDQNIRTENNLKEEKSVWDLFIMKENKFKQSSNMRSGDLESHEGSWKASEHNLTFLLNVNQSQMELGYTYEMKDDVLVLTRSNPTGTMKIITKFRKK